MLRGSQVLLAPLDVQVAGCLPQLLGGVQQGRVRRTAHALGQVAHPVADDDQGATGCQPGPVGVVAMIVLSTTGSDWVTAKLLAGFSPRRTSSRRRG